MDCVDAEYLYAAGSSVEHLCLVIQTSPVSNGLFLHHLPISWSPLLQFHDFFPQFHIYFSNWGLTQHTKYLLSAVPREIITHNSSLNSIPGLGVYTAKLQSPCCYHAPILPNESQTALLLLLRWTIACRHISDQMLCSPGSLSRSTLHLGVSCSIFIQTELFTVTRGE